MWQPLSRGCTHAGPSTTPEPKTSRTSYVSITCRRASSSECWSIFRQPGRSTTASTVMRYQQHRLYTQAGISPYPPFSVNSCFWQHIGINSSFETPHTSQSSSSLFKPIIRVIIWSILHDPPPCKSMLFSSALTDKDGTEDMNWKLSYILWMTGYFVTWGFKPLQSFFYVACSWSHIAKYNQCTEIWDVGNPGDMIAGPCQHTWKWDNRTSHLVQHNINNIMAQGQHREETNRNGWWHLFLSPGKTEANS